MVNFWSDEDPDFTSHWNQRLVGPIETETIGHIVLHTTCWMCLLFSLTLNYPLIKDVNKWWCIKLVVQIIDCANNMFRLELIQNESFVVQRIIMYYVRWSFIFLTYSKLAITVYLLYKYNPGSLHANNGAFKIRNFFTKFSPIYFIVLSIVAFIMPEEPNAANGTSLFYLIFKIGSIIFMICVARVFIKLLNQRDWCNDRRVRRILYFSVGITVYAESFAVLARVIPVFGGLSTSVVGLCAAISLVTLALFHFGFTVGLFYVSNMDEMRQLHQLAQDQLMIKTGVFNNGINTDDPKVGASGIQKSIQIEMGMST